MISLRSTGLCLAISLCLGCQPEPDSRLGPADGRDLPPTDLERIQVGQLAPDFTLPAFGGDTVTLSQYRGVKTVVLQFYRGHW